MGLQFTISSLYKQQIIFKMASMKILVIALFGIAMSQAGEITDLVEDCGSVGTITRVDMDGCDQDYDSCVVHYGKQATGKLYYTAAATRQVLDCKIYGNVGGIWVDFPGECPVTDGCAALEQGDCPVEAGEEIIYDIALDVESYFPQISLDGKWTLLDENAKEFVCFTFPITIST